jgi:hypothetical protein
MQFPAGKSNQELRLALTVGIGEYCPWCRERQQEKPDVKLSNHSKIITFSLENELFFCTLGLWLGGVSVILVLFCEY